MKKTLLNGKSLSVAACVLAVLLANSAMAQSQYFGVTAGITTGGTYSWDDPNWSVSGGTSAGPFASSWTAGDFARFYGGAGDNYTVTVNASEANTGLYLNAAGTTLNINDAGSGTGSLNIQTAIQGVLVGTGESLYVNVPITGNGGIAPELAGSLYLSAANSFTAGTALGDSGNTLTYFNNNNAFSSGSITLNRTGIANFSTLLSYGGAPITLANNFATVAANTGAGTALNFASGANAPVVSRGTWTLGTVNLNLRNSGGSTAPLTLSGAISGSGILALSANGVGNVTTLSGANPFSGQIIVTGSGGTYGGTGAPTLTLGAANTIASAANVTLAGGSLNLGGFRQIMTGTTLGLTASSTIDFTSLGSSLYLANSSALPWTGVLNIANWNVTDTLQFGTDSTGLTPAQLADIEFNGGNLGGAGILPNGDIYLVPEPSSLALGLLGGLGGLGILWNVRRRKA